MNSSKKKIKLYFFHPYSGKGGADLSISRLINGLDEKKYCIDFISLNKPYIKKKIKKKIKYKRIYSGRVLYSFRKIRQYIVNDNKNYEKKIFISNQYFVNVLTLLFLKNLKYLKIILLERNHLDEFNYFNGFYDLLKKKIIKLLVKIFYNKADLIIGNSYRLSKDLEKFTGKKIHTIYNPCYFSNKKVEKIYKKNNKTKIILNVSRLENQKDHLTLLKAFLLSKNKYNMKLLIIGYGKNLYSIKKYIKKNSLNKFVKIFSNVHNASNYYKKADLFILSSLYEGFPNVLVEAASFKIPIISTNCNSGPSEILLNGKGGYLVKVGDYKMISKKIDYFFNNEKNFHSKALVCYKNLKRFNFKSNLNKFDSLFKKI